MYTRPHGYFPLAGPSIAPAPCQVAYPAPFPDQRRERERERERERAPLISSRDTAGQRVCHGVASNFKHSTCDKIVCVF
jgi:hypothetical protein